MKTLPNGLTVFNATPHIIRFWSEDWDEPVEVAPDTAIGATPIETDVAPEFAKSAPDGLAGIRFVNTVFAKADEGSRVIRTAFVSGADVIVGSIIAAQAYPGLIVAMTPAQGYERVPPAQKRMNPDKFTVF